MASRLGEAEVGGPSVPLEGIELARARAWHAERPGGGPPRLSAAQLAAQLKAQASEHGLEDFVRTQLNVASMALCAANAPALGA